MTNNLSTRSPWTGAPVASGGGSVSLVETAISVRHLHKAYAQTLAVDDVSFDVQEGEIFGILGPNGAGKTTTVECLSGLRRPDTGQVRVLGLDPRADRDRLRKIVGVQLQDSQFPDKIQVGEAVDLYRSFYRDPADGAELLDRLGLSGTRHTRYAALSGGQQQRLAVALALIGRPRVAVLDELTTGLDPQARRETWDLIAGIRERGATVVLVTHFMEEAEYLCDRVVLIDHGRVIAEGTPAQLGEQAAGLTRLTFRPSQPLPTGLLADLPEVHTHEVHGGVVTVTGPDDVLQAVINALTRANIIAQHLRVHQSSLDDAFLALTEDHPPDGPMPTQKREAASR